MTADYIHGPTDPRETARLEHQARFVARSGLLDGFRPAPGARVLDLGCGVGAMIGQLRPRCPAPCLLVGIERQWAALRAAHANHPEAAYVLGDVQRLPFADASFEQVHGAWIMEHLPDPLAGLREVRRVLRPGGRCQLLEVDHASFATTPAIAEAAAVMAELSRRQVASGGDPGIGRRLGPLLRAAGFRDVRAAAVPARGSGADLAHYQDFTRVFIDIFEGVADALGPAWAPTVATAAARLRGLPDVPQSEVRYAPVLATAVR